MKATKIAAKSPIDGCIECGTGKWSIGGSVTDCDPSECIPGEYALLTKATSNTDGCTACSCGT